MLASGSPRGNGMSLEIRVQRKHSLMSLHMNLCFRGLKTSGLGLAISIMVSVKG